VNQPIPPPNPGASIRLLVVAVLCVHITLWSLNVIIGTNFTQINELGDAEAVWDVTIQTCCFFWLAVISKTFISM
jgi:hypothetical protein